VPLDIAPLSGTDFLAYFDTEKLRVHADESTHVAGVEPASLMSGTVVSHLAWVACVAVDRFFTAL
jgi:hypothetical protein